MLTQRVEASDNNNEWALIFICMQKVNIHIFEIHIYIYILVYMCIHAVNRSTAECSLTGGTGSLEILSKKLS